MTTTQIPATTVFVVSFTPANDDSSSVGGFEWRYARNLALAEYKKQVEASNEFGGSHIVRLVELQVPTLHRFSEVPTSPEQLAADAITEHINASIEDVESLLPAIQQYIPVTTKAEWVPAGGTR